LVIALFSVIATACASTVTAADTTSFVATEKAAINATSTDPHYGEAVTEAQHLLALAPIPPGATEVQGPPPKVLSGPAGGTPGSRHLLDSSQLWTVPMSMDETMKWVEDHAPAQVRSVGGSKSGNFRTGEVTSRGVSWGATSTVAYDTAQVEVGVAPDGPGRSILRADGMAVWISTAPVPDTRTGPRIRVTLKSGCPESIARYADVENQDAALEQGLVPPGDPTAGLICLYGTTTPSNDFNGNALQRSVILSSNAASELAQAVGAIRLGFAGGKVHSCPVDLVGGPMEIIVLGYAAEPDVNLWYGATGCPGLDNGFVEAGATGNLSFGNGFMPVIQRLTK